MASTSTHSGAQTAEQSIGVLVVDDHPAIRKVMARRIAETEQLRVVDGVDSAETALSVLEDREPDVAVVDISLGGIDGLTLTRLIRSHSPETQVLVFSMYDDSLYAERSIRAGASGYLSKDEPVDEVLSAIRSIADGRVHLRQDILAEMLDKVVRDGEEVSDSGLDLLTHREMTVFQMLGDGDTVSEIADRLDLSRKTVETHRREAKEKLGCDTVQQLLRCAVLLARDGKQLQV